MRRWWWLLPVWLLVAVLVAKTVAGRPEIRIDAEPAGKAAPRAAPSAVDASFLTAPLWNDGKAELAFYRVVRQQTRRGETTSQEFLVGTFLVKQEFDPVAQSKARDGAAARVSSFKSALFYEFESPNGYQYKRAYMTNAAQDGLRPLRQSFTSFDWCSNLYRELAFLPDGTVEHLRRSDDYGNEEHAFAYQEGAYPVALVPLLVRSLDFSGTREQPFAVLQEDGSYVPATAQRTGTDRVETPQGPRAAETIVVRYDGDVASPVGDRADSVETYWRGIDAARTLLRLEAESGRYRMTFVEQVRLAYWQENVFAALRHVRERP